MKYTFFLFTESVLNDAFPAAIEGLARDYDTPDEARRAAFAEAGKPALGAHSLRIACEDNRAFDEQWSRKSGKWERVRDLHSV